MIDAILEMTLSLLVGPAALGPCQSRPDHLSDLARLPYILHADSLITRDGFAGISGLDPFAVWLECVDLETGEPGADHGVDVILVAPGQERPLHSALIVGLAAAQDARVTAGLPPTDSLAELGVEVPDGLSARVVARGDAWSLYTTGPWADCEFGSQDKLTDQHRQWLPFCDVKQDRLLMAALRLLDKMRR